MALVWTSLHCLGLLPVGLFPDPSSCYLLPHCDSARPSCSQDHLPVSPVSMGTFPTPFHGVARLRGSHMEALSSGPEGLTWSPQHLLAAGRSLYIRLKRRKKEDCFLPL